MAYDLTAFVDAHPAGNWLIQLALGRDCTALFESYHLRPEVRTVADTATGIPCGSGVQRSASVAMS